MIVGEDTHQHLALGFAVGKRFKSFEVSRISDSNPVQLGHLHRADGRWRIYAFADSPIAGADSKLTQWADFMAHDPASPVSVHTPAGTDMNSLFDVKVIYQQHYTGVDIRKVPAAFKIANGPFALIDQETIFSAGEGEDIFDARQISRDGAVVIVRPDQYVAQVLPLDATEEMVDFLAGIFTV